jgi:hypothetical protein
MTGMTKKYAILTSLVLMISWHSAFASALWAADFYVATEGNDAWSGGMEQPNAAKTDGPVASIGRAQQLVRNLKAKEPQRARPIIVSIGGGTYYLPKTVVFAPADSGTPAAPVIYEAAAGQRPILSGGVRISGWQVAADGRWEVVMDEVKSGKWSFAQLFVNDQRRFRPRLPKQGYYAIAEHVAPSPKTQGRGADRFGFSGDQIRADWANRGDVEVIAFHQWAISRMRIAGLDTAKRIVTFTGQTCTPEGWGAFGKGNRFFVENVREALGEPGQWYLDRPSGRLTYVPRPGEKPDQTLVIAPRIEQLVAFFGDVKGRKWVHDIQLRGLTLAHSNWVLPANGQAFPQAEVGLNSAVAALGARDIVIDGCAVRHTGAYAMAFGVGCRNNRVENCEMVDLAGGGVKIGHAGSGLWEDSGRVPSDPEEVVSHQTVRNCTIAHAGRLHPAAIGVWIGHSPHNVVQHNDIFDLYYTSVSVGWIWGYSPSLANHNDIGFNHMHTIGQGVLSDMGGVYTLGTADGTRVHDNHIHDVQSFDYGGWGLYTDEGSTHITMDNNLVYRTRTGGFHQHYGKENRIQNNIFAFATQQQLQRTRTEPHLSFRFERNIVLWNNKSPLLGSNWNDNNFKLDNNVYWNAAGHPVTFFGGTDPAKWQKDRNQDVHSVIADPMFVDAAAGNFQLKPDSPALKLGFKPFDYTKAGRQTPPVLTKDLPPVPRGFDSPNRAE